MPDYIKYGDRPIAQPAFRILAYWPGKLSDPVVSAGLAAIFDIFVETYREQVAWVVVADDDRPMRGKAVTPDLLVDTRNWIASAPKVWPATARVFGPISPLNEQITVPSFRVEQSAKFGLLDIALPDDAPAAAAFADRVTEVLKTTPTLLCALMSMGFFLPQSLESLKREMPRTHMRYRAAIEFMAEGPKWGLTRDISNARWSDFPDAQEGIPDIGWRTIVGAHYLPRLGDVAVDAEGVTVEQTADMLIVTAGPAPIWGDVNIAEDIAPFRAVAAALAPARMSVDLAITGLFGGHRQDPDGIDRIEAWYERLED